MNTEPAPIARRFLCGGVVVDARGDAVGMAVLEARFGVTPTTREPELVLDLLARPSLPNHPAQAKVEGVEMWWDGDTRWFRAGAVGARLRAMHLDIGWPPGRPFDDRMLDLVCQFAMATALASSERALLHAAAVIQDGTGLLIIGGSGQGKSTLAAAAMSQGWALACDDLAVVRTGTPITVEGVRRAPLIPAEAVAGLEGATRIGRLQTDRRSRWMLPPTALVDGAFPLAAVILVEHGDDDGGFEPIPAADGIRAMLDGMAVPLVPDVVRAHLAVLARLTTLPLFRLRHAADPATRRDRSAQLFSALVTGLDRRL